MLPTKLTGEEFGIWIITDGTSLWLNSGDLPNGSAKQFSLINESAFLIGTWEDQNVWAVQASRTSSMYSPRQLLDQPIPLFQLIGKAVQLIEFHRSHKFCGYCGGNMSHSKHEWALLCSNQACKQRYYPQIAPCIIVAIRKDNHILLAKHARHKNDIHTVLAGFVEVGETIEDAVKREVKEECNIEVKNIRYVSSQPWPFPHSLMLAFMADYDSGEIVCDKKEILHADWHHAENLPQLPPFGTIARRLIEDTLVLCRQD